jgi:fido (protein-threonine AMPylation protein)
MELQFRWFRENDELRGLSLRGFAEKAAELINEINAAHPFVDGNGRTQRLWLQQIARNAGFTLHLSALDRAAWNAAARHGFLTSSKSMAGLIASRLSLADD